jgi:hypothetical protein
MIRLAVVVAAGAVVAFVAGCLDIRPADLFVLTRTGQGRTLTLLVSDGGTVTCDRGAARSLPDPLLLRARDLVGALKADARSKLSIPSPPRSVYRFRVRLQSGTVVFPDTAGRTHPVLAQVELLAVQVAAHACHTGG